MKIKYTVEKGQAQEAHEPIVEVTANLQACGRGLVLMMNGLAVLRFRPDGTVVTIGSCSGLPLDTDDRGRLIVRRTE